MIQYQIVSVHLPETFCPLRNLKIKFYKQRREEKLYRLYVILYLAS